MLRRVYAHLLALSASRHAPLWLAAIAFAESSFFPFPPDTLLIPMILARPRAAWRLAALCTAASVAGAILGYGIGYAVFDRLAAPLIRFYHYEQGFASFKSLYARWGFWVILVKGLTPIPFKIVTIASGAAHFNFPLFLAACVVTRGARFFLIAALLRIYGDRVRVFIEQRLTLVTTGALALVVGGLLALRFL